MVSLGLASFFSVGALLKSSAGSTLSQLLYFPEKQKHIKWSSEGTFIKQTAFFCKTLGFQNLYREFSTLTHLALLYTKGPLSFSWRTWQLYKPCQLKHLMSRQIPMKSKVMTCPHTDVILKWALCPMKEPLYSCTEHAPLSPLREDMFPGKTRAEILMRWKKNPKSAAETNYFVSNYIPLYLDLTARSSWSQNSTYWSNF